MQTGQLPFRLAILAVLTAGTACSSDDRPRTADTSPPQVAGTIQSDAILEASGLARSNERSDVLWAINDGGSPPALHAVGMDGADLGRVTITNIENTDWEDLAAFELNGARYLLIADIGDNGSSRETVSLSFVVEPNPVSDAEVIATRTLSIRYPDGPRDSEAMAVDGGEGVAYLLSKRTVPAELYSVPLALPAADAGPVTATYLGQIGSLPQPDAEDIEQAAALKDWHWQPTAMDFSTDGKTATILTYRAAYVYWRRDGQSWYEALQSSPAVRPLGDLYGAEALALTNTAIFVTAEAKNPPLLRFSY